MAEVRESKENVEGYKNVQFRDVKLKSRESGLSVMWLEIRDSESSILPFSLFLSPSATCGSLYPTEVPVSIYESLFSYSASLATSLLSVSCYIVTCDSGEAYLINLSGGGNCTTICYTCDSIIWADFVNFSGYYCICLLEKVGNLVIGKFIPPEKNICFSSRNYFLWQSLMLAVSPICCLEADGSLIVSDGNSSCLCNIVHDAKTSQFECQEMTLPYWGIICLKTNKHEILLTTCDGRCYRKTLLELKDEVKNNRKDEDSVQLCNLNLHDVMRGTKRCSEITKIEARKLNNLNMYLEQISLSNVFLSELPRNILHVDCTIQPSVEMEGMYVILLDITLHSHSMKFKGPWWQMSVKLKDCPAVNFVFSDIRNINDSTKLRIPVSISSSVVDRLSRIQNNSALIIYIDFVFCHFSTQAPVLSFNVHKEHLDIINFLTLQRIESLPSVPVSSFRDVAKKLHSTVKSSVLISDTPSSYKSSIILFDKHTSLLLLLFPNLNSCNCPQSVTYWLHDISLNLTCENYTPNKYLITLESASRPLVISVKVAVENRTLNNCKYAKFSKKEGCNISLSSDIIRQAHVSKAILELETGAPATQFVVQKLIEHINNLISSIPL